LSALPVGGGLYLLAQTKKGDTLAGGTTKFCITDIAFDIEGREHCTARGLKEAGFTPLTMRSAHDHMVHIGVKGLLP
jgi:uncharacterized membrane protein